MSVFADRRRDLVDPRDEIDLHWRFHFADGEIKAIRSPGIGDLYQPIRNVDELRCGPIEVVAHQEAWHPSADIDWRTIDAARRAWRIDAALRACTPLAREVLWRAYGARLDVPLAQLGGRQRAGAQVGVLVVQPALCNLVELAPEAERLRLRSGTPKALRPWLERHSAKAAGGRPDVGVVAALIAGARGVLSRAADEYSAARRKL